VSYPKEIDDSEAIVRVLRTPHHYKKGRMMPAALRPQRNTDLISVMRWSYRLRPQSVLKKQCQTIGNSGENTYCGVAALIAQCCRNSGTELVDAREEYDGHAHIVFPFVVLPNEPQEGEAFVLQNQITMKLMSCAEPILDVLPDDPDWTIQNEMLPLTD
jgi:hypothetical protein